MIIHFFQKKSDDSNLKRYIHEAYIALIMKNITELINVKSKLKNFGFELKIRCQIDNADSQFVYEKLFLR